MFIPTLPHLVLSLPTMSWFLRWTKTNEEIVKMKIYVT